MWRLNEIRGNVQLSSWYTVGAKYSLPNQVQAGTDSIFQIHFVLGSPSSSLILPETEKCSCTQMFPPPPATLETCALFILSHLSHRIGTQAFHSESSTGSMEGLAHLSAPWKNEWGAVSMCWAEGWQLGRIHCNYLFISEIWPRSVSVQTAVFSGAQLGIQSPSAPWFRWTEPGGGRGHPSLSLTSELCFVVTLSRSLCRNTSQWWLKDQLVSLLLFDWGVERHFLQSIPDRDLRRDTVVSKTVWRIF